MYETAYNRAICLCESNHDTKHKKILEEICVGLRKEQEQHMQRTSGSEDAFVPMKATRDYTDLVSKASETNCLSIIAAAICPCNKL